MYINAEECSAQRTLIY